MKKSIIVLLTLVLSFSFAGSTANGTTIQKNSKEEQVIKSFEEPYRITILVNYETKCVKWSFVNHCYNIGETYCMPYPEYVTSTQLIEFISIIKRLVEEIAIIANAACYGPIG